MSSITTYVILFFFVSNLLIFAALSYLALRPNRAKIFFSYSHKDTEAAQRLMDRFKGNHFRVWIDLGVAIPPDQLEKKLRKLIHKRQIFLLLASRNSVDSSWVKFEIERAKEQRKFLLSYDAWRDTVILALDEQGVQLYESLKKTFEDFVIYSIAKKATNEDQFYSFEQVREGVAELQTRKVLPFFRRAFVPTITLIDLRESYDSAMEQLSAYLVHNTRMGRITPAMRKPIKMVFFGFMSYLIFIIIFLGFLLLYHLDFI